MKKTIEKTVLIKLLTLATFTTLAYIPAFAWMLDRWSAKDTYYSHGYLVPFVSAFIVWQMREKLGKIKINPTNLGWLFFVVGILIAIAPALIYPAMAQMGLTGTSFPEIDFVAVGYPLYKLLTIFQ